MPEVSGNGAPTVAHLKTPYCGLTETFIYGYITHQRRYRPVVVTCEAVNLNQFPTACLVARPGPSRLDRLIMRFSIPLRGRQWPFERFWLRALQTHRPRIVHAHFGLSGIYLLPLRRAIRAPLITSFYGYDLSSLPRQEPFASLFRRRAIADGIDRFVVEGSAARRALVDLGCPPEKVSIVRIGVDLAKFPFAGRSWRAGGPLRLLFCGRFIPKKGLLVAIQAVARAAATGLPVTLRIVGYGAQEALARTLVAELGLASRVVFVGAVSHDGFRDELLRAHLVLAPSQTDPLTGETEGGAPTVLLEAQATGAMVVATRHADIPEVVRDGETGRLAEEGDADGLARCIIELAEAADRWPAMGRAARAHIEQRHNVLIETARLETLYDEVAAGWRGRQW